MFHKILPLAEDFDVVGCSVPNALDEDEDDVTAGPVVRREQESGLKDRYLRRNCNRIISIQFLKENN